MEHFTICVIYQAKSKEARDAFVRELAEAGVLNAIRSENGCLKYQYYNAVEDDKRLVLFEEWLDKGCQQVHMTQPHMKTAMEIKAKHIDSVELKQIEIL